MPCSSCVAFWQPCIDSDSVPSPVSQLSNTYGWLSRQGTYKQCLSAEQASRRWPSSSDGAAEGLRLHAHLIAFCPSLVSTIPCTLAKRSECQGSDATAYGLIDTAQPQQDTKVL